MRTKTSAGIALCRVDVVTGKPSIILIKKRLTYSYMAFVHGMYNIRDRAELMKLFNGMTIEERRDVLSFNFMQMWYRIWGHSNASAQFMSCKSKFESTFLYGGTTKLSALIAASTSATSGIQSGGIWEIPKGRKKSKVEFDMNCAVREFQEETSISKSQYRILPGATRTHSYIDNDVKYEIKYFIAVCRDNVNPRINMGDGAQIGEIAEIRWVNIEEARVLDPTGRLAARITPIFRYIKKHHRVIY